MNLLNYIVALVILGICDLFHAFLLKKDAKKVNYNCKNCKVWDCPAHYCNKKRGVKDECI